MHGLIFVTWEKYLSDRFGSSLLTSYRAKIGETPATAPHANHVYDDAILLAGVSAACELTGNPADILLREYGRYFIINGLTRHLCSYILTQVHDARELLLAMHDSHEQMSRIPDGLTPPLFKYTALAHDSVCLGEIRPSGLFGESAAIGRWSSQGLVTAPPDPRWSRTMYEPLSAHVCRSFA